MKLSKACRRGFYETAGVVKVFVFAFVFSLLAFLFLLLFLLLSLVRVVWIHLGLLYALAWSSGYRGTLWVGVGARCLMGPDGDESGLLSKARPVTTRPLLAVTRTRD